MLFIGFCSIGDRLGIGYHQIETNLFAIFKYFYVMKKQQQNCKIKGKKNVTSTSNLIERENLRVTSPHWKRLVPDTASLLAQQWQLVGQLFNQ